MVNEEAEKSATGSPKQHKKKTRCIRARAKHVQDHRANHDEPCATDNPMHNGRGGATGSLKHAEEGEVGIRSVAVSSGEEMKKKKACESAEQRMIADGSFRIRNSVRVWHVPFSRVITGRDFPTPKYLRPYDALPCAFTRFLLLHLSTT